MGSTRASLGGRRIAAVGLAVALSATSACRDDGADTIRPHEPPATAPRSADAADAAVAVRVSACRPVAGHGAGLMVAPGLVLTSAHVVAGATSIRVVRDGVDVPAAVVAFDPVDDLAVLEVPADLASYVPLADEPPVGSFEADVVLLRGTAPVVTSVRVHRRVAITTEDIYRGARVERAGYELSSDIEPGDSGAVLVLDGEAVAVVWSRSRDTAGRAWAIDAVRGGAAIRDQLASGSLPDDVDLGRCA